MPIQEISGLAAIADDYDAFLVDVWGVLHDGLVASPFALQCLQTLRHNKKIIIILSNAARRQRDMVTELNRFGIDNHHYDHIVSSGELTWQAIHKRSDEWLGALGKRVYYLGPQRSRGILDQLDIELTDEPEQADFIINTGVEGNLPDTRKLRPLLDRLADTGLPMICANPDRIAIRGGVAGISAGALARDYARAGGQVRYFGKPWEHAYQACYQLIPEIRRERILAIGDGLETDILGANRQQIDSIFIINGIHQNDYTSHPGYKASPPDYCIDLLRWS